MTRGNTYNLFLIRDDMRREFSVPIYPAYFLVNRFGVKKNGSQLGRDIFFI